RVLYWSALICASTSVGVALVANDMVDLVLGRQWVDAKPLMPWLAIAYGILGLSSSVYSAFDVIGRPRVSATLQWTRFGLLLICIAPVAFVLQSARDVAITRLVVTVVITPGLFFALSRALEVDGRDFLATLWRPVAASAFMAGAVVGANYFIAFT